MNSNTSTGSTIRLNQASLSLLPGNVRVPKYDRHQITNGIVHIGVGAFHRSHQALYLDDYFHQNLGSNWGTCGVGLLDSDYDRRMRDALGSQDCLYTLVERLSCDNIQGNGNMVQKMLTTFAQMCDPELGRWIAEYAAFPNCMVDRITPITTPADIKMVAEQFGIDDAFPGVTAH